MILIFVRVFKQKNNYVSFDFTSSAILLLKIRDI